MELRYPDSDGGDVVCQIPASDSPGAADLLDFAAGQLASEYGVQRRKMSPSERFKWLRPPAYELISACLDSNIQHLLYRRTMRAGRYNRGGIGSPNPFQLGLMAIFADDPLFAKEDRHRLGQTLWYAYRHYVPSCFINGFAAQVGAMTQDKADSLIEPKFADWIIERRLMDIRSDNPRGSYPPEIEAGVEKFRRELGATIGRISSGRSEL